MPGFVRRKQFLRKQSIYRAIEAEHAQREQRVPVVQPLIVEPSAEDQRDPIEMARAAGFALKGSGILEHRPA